MMIKAYVLVKQLQIEPVDRLPSYSNALVLYSRGGLCGLIEKHPNSVAVFQNRTLKRINTVTRRVQVWATSWDENTDLTFVLCG